MEMVKWYNLTYTYLSIYLSIYLSNLILSYLISSYLILFYLILSIYLSICLSAYLSIYLSIHLSIYLSIYLSKYIITHQLNFSFLCFPSFWKLVLYSVLNPMPATSPQALKEMLRVCRPSGKAGGFGSEMTGSTVINFTSMGIDMFVQPTNR